MPYTFGAATSDSLSLDPPSGAMSATSIFLGMGWYYLTTRTSQRNFWSLGGSSGSTSGGLEMYLSGTMEVRGIVNRTGSAYYSRTSGVDITTDKWWFIAGLLSSNASSPAVSIWVGDTDTAPQEYAYSTTAGSGTVLAANHVLTGNDSLSGAGSFRGQIGSSGYWYASGSSNANVFGVAPSDVTAPASVTSVLHKFVLPFYLGQYDKIPTRNSVEEDGLVYMTPMMAGGRAIGYTGTPTRNPYPSISGATFTSTPRDPHPMGSDPYRHRSQRGRR